MKDWVPVGLVGKLLVVMVSYTCAIREASHAEGTQIQSLGTDSHAEGFPTVAGPAASHLEGYQTSALGIYSHAKGINTATAISGIAAHLKVS